MERPSCSSSVEARAPHTHLAWAHPCTLLGTGTRCVDKGGQHRVTPSHRPSLRPQEQKRGHLWSRSPLLARKPSECPLTGPWWAQWDTPCFPNRPGQRQWQQQTLLPQRSWASPYPCAKPSGPLPPARLCVGCGGGPNMTCKGGGANLLAFHGI